MLKWELNSHFHHSANRSCNLIAGVVLKVKLSFNFARGGRAQVCLKDRPFTLARMDWWAVASLLNFSTRIPPRARTLVTHHSRGDQDHVRPARCPPSCLVIALDLGQLVKPWVALHAMWTFQMEQEPRRMVDTKTGNLFQMEQMTPATMMRTGKELAAEGMTQREIADVLGINKITVHRDITGTNVPPESTNSADNDEPPGTFVPRASERLRRSC